MAGADFPGEYAYFGDATFIVIKEAVDKKNTQGVWERKISFKMHDDFKNKFAYLLKTPVFQEDPITGLISRSYPRDYFHLLDPNPKTKTWQILCTFGGEESPLMELIEKGLMSRLIESRKEVERYRLSNAKLGYENKKLIESSAASAGILLARAKQFKELGEEQKQGTQPY